MAVVHATFGKTADERAEEAIVSAANELVQQIVSGSLSYEQYQHQAGFLKGLQQAAEAIKQARRNKGEN